MAPPQREPQTHSASPAEVAKTLARIISVLHQPEFAQVFTQALMDLTGAEDGTLLWFKSDQLPEVCLLYTSPSPRDRTRSRMPSSA